MNLEIKDILILSQKIGMREAILLLEYYNINDWIKVSYLDLQNKYNITYYVISNLLDTLFKKNYIDLKEENLGKGKIKLIKINYEIIQQDLNIKEVKEVEQEDTKVDVIEEVEQEDTKVKIDLQKAQLNKLVDRKKFRYKNNDSVWFLIETILNNLNKTKIKHKLNLNNPSKTLIKLYHTIQSCLSGKFFNNIKINKEWLSINNIDLDKLKGKKLTEKQIISSIKRFNSMYNEEYSILPILEYFPTNINDFFLNERTGTSFFIYFLHKIPIELLTAEANNKELNSYKNLDKKEEVYDEELEEYAEIYLYRFQELDYNKKDIYLIIKEILNKYIEIETRVGKIYGYKFYSLFSTPQDFMNIHIRFIFESYKESYGDITFGHLSINSRCWKQFISFIKYKYSMNLEPTEKQLIELEEINYKIKDSNNSKPLNSSKNIITLIDGM